MFVTFYIRNKQHDSVYKIIQKETKKNASNRKISPPLIILHDGNASMHDIESAMLTIFSFVNGLVGTVKKRWRNLLLQVFFVQIKSF